MKKCEKWPPTSQDSALLKHIAGGIMIATEAKYHKKCMTNLTNRHTAFLRQIQDCQSGEEDKKNETRALVELISFMESCLDDGEYVHINPDRTTTVHEPSTRFWHCKRS